MNSFAIRRLRLHCALFALLLSLLSIPAAQAQTGIYGQFSASHFNSLPNTNEWGYGGGFGLYSDFLKVPFGKIGGGIRLHSSPPAPRTTPPCTAPSSVRVSRCTPRSFH